MGAGGVLVVPQLGGGKDGREADVDERARPGYVDEEGKEEEGRLVVDLCPCPSILRGRWRFSDEEEEEEGEEEDPQGAYAIGPENGLLYFCQHLVQGWEGS